ncbi:DUF2269 domain-containing protein [Corynebacterium pelargi]|uniref:Uncharacterized protein n=1 Tax=Corynebacterium pelargi TaxID=1471400 RepID=A0A410W9J2_9CORY|nr:DUF2269 domain-containing protein [Corynebacterium pelargi]QAU52622.1 hypothetical protein CPELA_06800 [Corynebacterium pelargi]GGG77723.1 hypothetical protein GCM10007338_14510 [Corynebacterium pelargi]
MSSLLVILHVLAAVLFLGPVTVAVSMFGPRALAASRGDEHAKGSVKTLHRITSVYGILSLFVPMIGIALMFTGDYWSEGRFHASILLSLIAWAVLFFLILPRQTNMAGALGALPADEQAEKTYSVNNWQKAKSQVAMYGGIFSALWVIVFILMML